MLSATVGCVSLWKQKPLLVSVSTQDGIVVLGKTHACSPHLLVVPPPPPSPNVTLETVPMFVWLNADLSVRHFLSVPLFPSGDQCCDAHVCPCSESSSSLTALLPCQAVKCKAVVMSAVLAPPCVRTTEAV